MRVFKYLFFALLFLVIGFYLYGLLILKDEVTVSRSIEIERPARMVYKSVNSMHNFNQWSPWPRLDPDAQFSYQGPKSGVGSQMTWSGNQEIGSGVQTIIETIEHEKVKTKTEFKSKGNEVSYTTYQLTELGPDRTQVEWIYETNSEGNILRRYVGSMLDGILGPQYEQGLQNLKELVESQPVYDFSAINEISVDSQNILFIPVEVATQQDINSELSSAYTRIMGFMGRNQLVAATPPMAVYKNIGTGVPGGQGAWRINAAIGVNVDGLSGITSELQLGRIDGGRVLKLIQIGSYEQAEKSYELLDAYMDEQSLQAAGSPWEVYINDPATVAESELETHIYQPISDWVDQ